MSGEFLSTPILDVPPGKKTGKRRGKYNPACDVCARKKTKCDGVKPKCGPCLSTNREAECAWTKNPARKPRSEAHFQALHKRAESLKALAEEYRRYCDYLESLVVQCHQRHENGALAFDFRSMRPKDLDGLLGGNALPDIYLEEDTGLDAVGDDDHSTSSNEDPMNKGNLKIEEDGYILSHSITSPFSYQQPSTDGRIHVSRFPAVPVDPNETYTLMVDGVDPSSFNPNFDWSRHLPTSVPLDRRSHDKALDLLFKFFTSWCLKIVPALFQRDMYRALSMPQSQTPPRTAHYSPMLHNALLSLGLAFLDDERLRDLRTRKMFADAAKSFIEAECQKPNLSVVHALSILGSFHSSQGEQTLGYLYFGMSARISQALGLNADCAEWVKQGLLTESDRLDRLWTYWTTFAQDICWSLYVGRDFCVPDPQVEAESPRDRLPYIDEELDAMEWVYAPSGLDPQPNHLTLTFRSSCELFLVGRRIMDVVHTLNKPGTRSIVIDEIVSDIDLSLNTWRGALHPDLESTVKSKASILPHKLMLHLSYWWLFALLHRPFFARKTKAIYSNDREIDHVKLSRRAAENIMELVTTWRTLYSLRYCPITLIQTLFSAGTIWFLTARQAASGSRVAHNQLKIALDQHRLALQYLHEIGKSWQCATNIATILRNLMHQQLKPLLDEKIPRNPSTSKGPLRVPDTNDEGEASGPALSRRPSRRDITKPTKSHSSKRSVSHNVGDSESQPASALTLQMRQHAALSPTISVFPAQDTDNTSSNPLPSPSPSGTHSRYPSLSVSVPPDSPLPSSPLAPLSPALLSTSPIDINRAPDSAGTFSESPIPGFLDTDWTAAFGGTGLSPSPGTSPAFGGYSGPSSYQQSGTFRQNSLFDDMIHHPFSQQIDPLSAAHPFASQGLHPGHATLHRSASTSSMNFGVEKNFGGDLGMPGGQPLSQAPYVGLFSLDDGVGNIASLRRQHSSTFFFGGGHSHSLSQDSVYYESFPEGEVGLGDLSLEQVHDN